MQSVASHNEVKIYNVSAGKSMPQWLEEQKKRSLRYDQEYRRRIELIQDLQFPTASTRIRQSADGCFLAATGVYPPQVRVYEFDQLSIKFERHMDCDAVQFLMLSEDWRKMVFLQSDRTIEFHAQYGTHFKVRIPKHGRDMTYNKFTCDLYIGGTGSEVYRLNLDQGRFLESIATGVTGTNAISYDPTYQLITCAGEDGVLECFDARSRTRVGMLAVGKHLKETLGLDATPQLTALSVRERDGLAIGVGTSSGQALLYDLRSSRPWITKDHQYEFPVNSIVFHGAHRDMMLTADTKAVKMWNAQSGEMFTSIEPESSINELVCINDSGLIMLANEAEKVQIYYVPELAPAPNWASFLDNLTEELEENDASVYDEYTFVTRGELQRLTMEHMIGTPFLKAYMHGFFMDTRLYNKIKAAVNPFAYDDWKEKEIATQVRATRKSRLGAKQAVTLPPVNASLAKQLIKGKRKEARQAGVAPMQVDEETARNPLGDDRFADLFTDDAFTIDTESDRYKLLHPTKRRYQGDSDDEIEFLERFTRHGESDDDSSVDAIQAYEDEAAAQRVLEQGSISSSDLSSSAEERIARHLERQRRRKGKGKGKGKSRGARQGPRLQASADDMAGIDAQQRRGDDHNDSGAARSLGSRIKQMQIDEEADPSIGRRRKRIGNFETTFYAPEKKVKSAYQVEQEKHLEERRKRRRRGVRALGFKKDTAPQGRRGGGGGGGGRYGYRRRS